MNYVNPIELVPTYTRTGNATAWRKDGTLAEFAPNVPRITDAGVMIEGQRTNLFARWDPTAAQVVTKAKCTDAVAPAVAPLAGRNWIALDNTVESAFCYQTGPNAASTTYTISVFVETADGSQPVAGTTTTMGDFGFVLAGDLVLSSATYRRVAGNVWRVSVTDTTRAVTTGSGAGIVRYTGQSIRPLKFSGFQLELGTRASTPIITTGAAATVGADNLYMGGLTDALGGDWSVVLSLPYLPQRSEEYVFSVSAGVGTFNMISVSRFAPTTVVGSIRSGHADVGSTSAITVGGNLPVKVAARWRGGKLRFAVNGTLSTEVTPSVAPVGALDRLAVGSGQYSSGILNGVVQSTTLFPYALTDAELVEMTRAENTTLDDLPMFSTFNTVPGIPTFQRSTQFNESTREIII